MTEAKQIWIGPFLARAAKQMVRRGLQFEIDGSGTSIQLAIPTNKTPFPELHLKYQMVVDAFPLCPWAYLASVETGRRVGLPWPWLGLKHSMKQCGRRLKAIA